MNCKKRSDYTLTYKGMRLFCELDAGHDGKCAAFTDDLTGKILDDSVLFEGDPKPKPYTPAQLADLRRKVEYFSDDTAYSKGEILRLLATVDDLQDRYDCNTAIMHARTGALNRSREKLTELLQKYDPAAVKDAWDLWRNKSAHECSLGGDPYPRLGDQGSEELFIRHEAYAAFRAGERFGRTKSPFKERS